MEDPRLSRMYLASLKRWHESLFHNVWRRNLMRSGMVTGLALTLLVAGLSFAYRERGRGHLHKLQQKIVADRQDARVPEPGGQEAVSLTRTRFAGDSQPEFLSVTMLPGRGMNILQIGAFIPDRGEVNLLASPTVEEAEQAMTGRDADANGAASLAIGGAIEVPWAGRIGGTVSADRVIAGWRGHSISLPATGAVATGGLMLARGANSVDTSGMLDGGQADASFDAEDFGAHWPSKTDVHVTVLLSSRAVELTVTAKNTGDVAEPVGIGWTPRFAIFDGRRAQMKMRIPAETKLAMSDKSGGMPTGATEPVAGVYNFSMRGGAELGRIDVNDVFVHLHRELLDTGPAVELNDPADHYGLRMTLLSSSIQAIQVTAPAKANYVSIAPQYNYDDPFGRQWSKDTDTGMVVLQPGQSTQWKVRLELVSLTDSATAN